MTTSIQYIQSHNLFRLFADFVASRMDKQFFEVELLDLSHEATAFIELAAYLNLYPSDKSEDYVKFLRLIATYAHFLKFVFTLETITNDKTILKKDMDLFISIDFDSVISDLVLAQLELSVDLSLHVNTIKYYESTTKHFEMVRNIVVKFEAYQEYLADPTPLKKLPSLED